MTVCKGIHQQIWYFYSMYNREDLLIQKVMEINIMHVFFKWCYCGKKGFHIYPWVWLSVMTFIVCELHLWPSYTAWPWVMSFTPDLQAWPSCSAWSSVMSCHIMSHVMSCHIMLYIMSYIMLCHNVSSYGICHIMSVICHNIWHNMTWHDVMWHAMTCYDITQCNNMTV